MLTMKSGEANKKAVRHNNHLTHRLFINNQGNKVINSNLICLFPEQLFRFSKHNEHSNYDP